MESDLALVRPGVLVQRRTTNIPFHTKRKRAMLLFRVATLGSREPIAPEKASVTPNDGVSIAPYDP